MSSHFIVDLHRSLTLPVFVEASKDSSIGSITSENCSVQEEDQTCFRGESF